MNQGLSTCRNTCIQKNLKSYKVRCAYIHLCTYSSFCRRPTFWRRFLFLLVYFLFVLFCVFVSFLNNYIFICICNWSWPLCNGGKYLTFQATTNLWNLVILQNTPILKLLTCKRLALNHFPSHYIDIICCREICWSKKMKKEQKYRLILRIKDPRSIVTRFLWCPVDKSHWLHLTRFDSSKVSLGTWSL